MTMTRDNESMGYGLPPIKETIGRRSWFGRRRSAPGFIGRTIGSTLAMTVACGATMLVASQLRSGSPWGGLNAMATAVGLGPRRARKRFDRSATLAGAGVLAAGLLAYAIIYEGVLSATGRRRSLMTGLLAGLGGYATDQLLMRRELVPNFRRTLGDGGTLAKYAALGLMAAR
ncbi:MAG: hypothetical protein JWP87_1374 [Labilithrix sp.]|nr:hypothetical protein [Labilithrix sp.]